MNARRKNEIPADLYIPFVETLFRDGRTLAIGMVAQTLLIMLVYWKTMNPLYLGVAAGMVVVGALRMRNFRKYTSLPMPRTWQEARRRENDYIFYGSLHGGMLGIFCLFGIYFAHDDFAEIASICITLATATSIAGRNYASPRMVIILIIALTWPISIGFLLRGDFYHVVLGLFSAPFLFAIKKFADTVRDVLSSAILEQKKAKRLAQRFNRALNTMSHGLIMLAPSGRVVVANAEAAKLMWLKSSDALLGRSMHALLRRGVAGGILAEKDCRYVESQLAKALREGRRRKILVSFSNGQHYEFSAREGSQELGVITFEDVTQRVEAESKIRSMARYDGLTGLPNRAYFHELVAEFMSSGDPDRLCALAVIDLDDFKSVNDTLGHPVGDGLIYAVAERLVAFDEEGVKVSRFGGDEFMVYFDKVIDEDDLNLRIDAVFNALQGDVDVAGHNLRIQASGGAVLSVVRDSDVDGMIVKSDLALYKAKEIGKANWQLFEASIDEAFRNKQLMKADLRGAIAANALRVVYQPIVAIDTMRITSCEALCRWDHPDLGAVSPSVFIPLAEEMGVISDISNFMLKSACAECVKWPDKISVSVNLSARDFRQRSVVDRVKEALESSGLEAHRLEIEVTETALLDDKSLTRTYVAELRALGVRIALDDFGTGYSSLSYLHKLPLDKVKIDRSFLIDVTQNARSLELLKGIVGLCRLIKLSVTIEGVETFEQLKIITQEVKPDLVQGFLFGSALSASGIDSMSLSVWPFADESTKELKRRKL
ncbi:EAL domain-containing protein [Mesorhizobium sp. SB112]|uniref:putative bifunctional diguanylate cyclase/phosphodiesterase n=2 Tax=Pseudomonadota TaxID=1224 RepID=UPI003264D063